MNLISRLDAFETISLKNVRFKPILFYCFGQLFFGYIDQLFFGCFEHFNKLVVSDASKQKIFCHSTNLKWLNITIKIG